MNTKSKLLSTIISVTFLLLGAFLGMILSQYLYLFIWPWKQYKIAPPPISTGEFLYAVIRFSHGLDPTGDILYVISEDGAVFSNTLFEDDWKKTSSNPNEFYKLSSCPTEWLPLIKNNITSSIGIQYSDEFSGMRRCYILFNDGSLRVRTRGLDIYTGSMLAWLGLFTGAIIGVIISKRVY